MARKPFMAGNWKMNLDHLEAIAHVQKIAFGLKDEDFAEVEAGVMVPFTDIRSVQTVVPLSASTRRTLMRSASPARRKMAATPRHPSGGSITSTRA